MNGPKENRPEISEEKRMQPTQRTQLIRATRRAASRGLTLVELVIVITIIGVLTAAISIGVLQAGKKANMGAAATACDTIRQATIQWKAVHPTEDCPTVEQLKTDRDLDTGFSLKDPWGSAYKLNCDSDEITCTSPGPDRKEGTEDDIHRPKLDTPEKQ
jgi:general secretion pathway protein G